MKLLQFVLFGLFVCLHCVVLVDSKKFSKSERLTFTRDVRKLITELNNEIFQELFNFIPKHIAKEYEARSELCFSSNNHSTSMWKLTKKSKKKVCKQISRINHFNEEFTSTCKRFDKFINFNTNENICEFFDYSKHLHDICNKKDLNLSGLTETLQHYTGALECRKRKQHTFFEIVNTEESCESIPFLLFLINEVYEKIERSFIRLHFLTTLC